MHADDPTLVRFMPYILDIVPGDHETPVWSTVVTAASEDYGVPLDSRVVNFHQN